jgi:hypothetical protein
VLSRVKQARPIRERIEIWRSMVEDLNADPPTERRFELMDNGELIPWKEGPPNAWTRGTTRQPNPPRKPA